MAKEVHVPVGWQQDIGQERHCGHVCSHRPAICRIQNQRVSDVGNEQANDPAIRGAS